MIYIDYNEQYYIIGQELLKHLPEKQIYYLNKIWNTGEEPWTLKVT